MMKTAALLKELNKLAVVAREGGLTAFEIGEIVREVDFTLREARHKFVAAKAAAKAAANRRKLTPKEKAARAATRRRNERRMARMTKDLTPFVNYYLTGHWNGKA